MCELLGASLNKAVSINDYLTEFFSHSVRHPHGWGLLRESCGKMELIKEQLSAGESELAAKAVRTTQPQKTFLAHIRYATVGSTQYANCHPFYAKDNSGRVWVFIHNGTLYSDRKVLQYAEFQEGNTDSERAFLYLIDKVNEKLYQTKKDLTKAERFCIADNFAQALSFRNKLNFMIFDGEILYVHKNMKQTLYYKKASEGFYFSTVPLDKKGWCEFPDGQLFAYLDGRCLFTGTAHGNMFKPTLQYITAMDAMNI